MNNTKIPGILCDLIIISIPLPTNTKTMEHPILLFKDASVTDYPMLIFEKDEIISGGINNMVMRVGFKGRIDIVTNLKHAVELLNETKYKLMIFGIHINDSEDLKTLEIILENNKDLKVIVNSHVSTQTQQELYMKMGAHGIINHEILFELFLQVILTVRKNETYFDYLDITLKDNKNEVVKKAAKNLKEDIIIDKLALIIIREVKKFKKPKEIAKLKEMSLSESGIKKRTEGWREFYDVKTTRQVIKIMEDRGMLKGLDEI